MSFSNNQLSKIARRRAGNFFCVIGALFFSLAAQPQVAAQGRASQLMSAATLSFNVAQSSQPQPNANTTTKQSPKRTSPLDLFSSLAGLAAVIAIAYAGLPNFRHRSRVQEHVRRRVKDENIIQNLNQTLCNQESWGVLYRLGKLQEVKELKAPAPGLKTKSTDVDRNFQMRSSFKAYNWIYASNFDKNVAGLLAALAATVIWFAAIDNYLFFEATVQDQNRIAYLSELTTYYVTLGGMLIITMIAQRFLWHSDMPEGCWRHICIRINMAVFCIILFLLSMFTTLRLKLFADLYWRSQHEALFIIIFFVLFTCAIVPLVLWSIGEALTRTMIREADISIEALVGIINENAGTAKIS